MNEGGNVYRDVTIALAYNTFLSRAKDVEDARGTIIGGKNFSKKGMRGRGREEAGVETSAIGERMESSIQSISNDLPDGATLQTRKYEDASKTIYTCIKIYEPLMYRFTGGVKRRDPPSSPRAYSRELRLRVPRKVSRSEAKR